MKKRTLRILAAALSLTLGCGQSLSLAATPKEGRKPSYYPLSTRPSPAPARRSPGAPRAQKPSPVNGQAATTLSDGRTLLTGGEGANGPQSTAMLVDPRTGEATPLPGGLRRARAWHSATTLPDGRILILGGVGAGGRTLDDAETFDPATNAFDVIKTEGLTPRAYHTATLLTDGRVLVVGGQSDKGEMLGGAELWDFKTGKAMPLQSGLYTARRQHRATLLAGGGVLIEGGSDANSNQITSSELYDAESQGFSFTNITPEASDNAAPSLAASLPTGGATDVPVDGFIALRFSKRLRVDSLNTQTITLSAPEGALEVRVVPAEGGRLAFATPRQPLPPGVTYTVTVSGASDETNHLVSPATVSFTTKGEAGNPPPGGEDWVPDATNFRGDWRSRREDSPWSRLPLLEAGAGVTAIAGRALKLDGNPLADVTLRVGSRTAQTDRTGRFLLTDVGVGHQVMIIDGRTASRPNKVYGIFKVGVEVKAGKTNPLGYTIWMPKLDMADAVTIKSPTTTAVTVTNPHIPYLELRLPAGTVIRDTDGQAVTRISITAVPTDRPPFPLPPGIHVPVFFTVQPGGARVIPPRAQLIYPNFTGQPAGARVDFWNYDPEGKGWYVYGHGTVSRDGKQVFPDPGVVIYEFSGIMLSTGPGVPGEGPADDEDGVGGGDFGGGGAGGGWGDDPGFGGSGAGGNWPGTGGPGPGGPDRPKRRRSGRGGDPIDLATGLFVLHETDLYLPDILPLSLTRTYRPQDFTSRPFGIGASHPYEIFLVGDSNPYTYVDLVLPGGGRVHYDRISSGTGYADAVYQHTSSPSIYYGSKITWNGNGWNLSFKSGAVFTFPESSGANRQADAALIGMRDRYGNAVSLTRDANRNLTRITSPNGRWIELTYDTSNRITQAKDNAGRTVTYTYDAGGRLWKVTNPNGGITEYTYDSSHRMLTAKNERGIVYLTNEYDANGRVIKQTLPDDTPDDSTDNPTFQFAYTLGADGKVTQTDVTDPRGGLRRVTFNAAGYPVSDTVGVGASEQQGITYERQAGTNIILSETDHTGRKTAYTRDADGYITAITNLAGSPDATTTTFTYEPNFKGLSSVTGPLNQTVSFSYDSQGNLTAATDLLNRQTTFAYNAAGQLTSEQDLSGNSLQLTYNSGDLVEMTDAQGRVTRRFVDSAGRLLALTDAQGQKVRYEYDGLDQLVKVTDPLLGETSFVYDPDGNLLSVRDARASVTTYTYDSADRLLTCTDPSQRAEHYEYDKAGNLIKFTDRRGVVMGLGYDVLDRLQFLGYRETTGGTYESTVTFIYDGLGRVTQVTDSLAGTITRGYNSRDQLTSETTPQGAISYSFDSAGRLASKTVAGQPALTYAYDSVNRLSGIAQGAATVTFGYDSASRLAALTLPNGVVSAYGYDGQSQLTSITYKKDATVLGDLSYGYDAAGRRTTVGGSFARSGAPPALGSATYDESNQLRQWGAAALSYDANGNLISDGSRTYTWDARNQLAAVAGPGLTASFQYDALGRRTRKIVNGVTTEYLYDGAQAVQELSGGTPTANMLTGGVDEVFSRTDAAGTQYLLTDYLGSTVALADNSGAVQTQYTYDAFGQTTVTGAPSANPYQYAGRENDGDIGLYYYRNRYYSPTLQRFISQDPIGLSGGINLYAYAGNDPANHTDPFGLDKKKRGPGRYTDDFGRGNGSAAGKAIVTGIVGLIVATVATFGGGTVAAAGGGGSGGIIVTFAAAVAAFLGHPYPTKPNYGGKQQPYDPETGRYLPYSANPGLTHSMAGHFSIGVSQGLGVALTPGPPDFPPATSTSQLIGQIIGWIIGTLRGP